jgi:hypothetical protein
MHHRGDFQKLHGDRPIPENLNTQSKHLQVMQLQILEEIVESRRFQIRMHHRHEWHTSGDTTLVMKQHW